MRGGRSARDAASFDEYAQSYSDALRAGLSATGENQEFFAERRVAWLAKRLDELRVTSQAILDFGCGQGGSTPILLNKLQAASAKGVDTSAKLVALARQRNSDLRVTYDEIRASNQPSEEFDCAYANGVFHHIPARDRLYALQYIITALKPGGFFAFYENNPWNPGTRFVMRRISFDREAVTITIPEAVKLVSEAGFEVAAIDSLFFFPRLLRILRPLEQYLSPSRLGAQYLILCRKPVGD